LTRPERARSSACNVVSAAWSVGGSGGTADAPAAAGDGALEDGAALHAADADWAGVTTAVPIGLLLPHDATTSAAANSAPNGERVIAGNVVGIDIGRLLARDNVASAGLYCGSRSTYPANASTTTAYPVELAFFWWGGRTSMTWGPAVRPL